MLDICIGDAWSAKRSYPRQWRGGAENAGESKERPSRTTGTQTTAYGPVREVEPGSEQHVFDHVHLCARVHIQKKGRGSFDESPFFGYFGSWFFAGEELHSRYERSPNVVDTCRTACFWRSSVM